MKRKLIQLSPSTIVASLPAKWIQKNNLKKGNEIQITEIENTLVLSTETKKAESKITLDLTNLNENLTFLHADSAYIAGYDIIEFLIKGKEQAKIMQYVATEVPGMIISEQTNTKITFSDITAGKTEDINTIINRILNMNIAMLQDASQYCKDKDWEELRRLKRRDYITGSYISYCQRLVNKYGYSAFTKTGLIVNYVKILEMIADKYCAMCKIVAKENIKADTEIDAITEIYKQIQRVHQTYSQKKIVDINLRREQLQTTHTKLSFHMQSIKELCFDLLEVEVQLQL